MNGNSAIFTQIGGARIGTWNATKPLAELSITRDEICLSCFRRDYVFPKNNILALTKYRFLSLGLRIHHDVPLRPNFIVFWVSYLPGPFTRLKEKLEAFGYEVEG